MKRLIGFLSVLACGFSTAFAAPQIIYSNQVQPTYQVPPASDLPTAHPMIGHGYYTPFVLGIVGAAQLPPGRVDVGGLRLNLLHNEVENMDGIDIGGLYSVVNGNTRALQIAPIIQDKCDAYGIQIGVVEVVNNYCDGIQIGAFEYARQMSGLQIGVYNGSENFEGLQIGLVNYARSCRGMQIGLVNVIPNSELPFFPIINCHF
ncbi:MAG: hypothetical protein IKR48_01205 [Kiritimatiellae bacterium]|nr:hypothetical protein [Kiritimatiellia bacterium]